jgi:hypothetical protein
MKTNFDIFTRATHWMFFFSFVSSSRHNLTVFFSSWQVVWISIISCFLSSRRKSQEQICWKKTPTQSFMWNNVHCIFLLAFYLQCRFNIGSKQLVSVLFCYFFNTKRMCLETFIVKLKYERFKKSIFYSDRSAALRLSNIWESFEF